MLPPPVPDTQHKPHRDRKTRSQQPHPDVFWQAGQTFLSVRNPKKTSWLMQYIPAACSGDVRCVLGVECLIH